MARETEGYRETAARLYELFPGRMALTRQETAQVLGCSVRTVQRNPGIPRMKTGRTVRYPIDGLARWMAREATTG